MKERNSMMAIQDQRVQNNRSRMKEQLSKKLQYSFKRSGHPSPMPEADIEAVLNKWVLARKIPNLIDPSFRPEQQRKFKAALRSNKSQSPTDHSTKNAVDDGDDEYDRKVKESIVFEFGNDYFRWVDFNLQGSISRNWNFTNKVFLDSVSTSEIEDSKYSRDGIFWLSSLDEVFLEYSRMPNQ